MPELYEKVSDTEIKVTRTVSEVKEHSYTLDYLLNQKAAIEAQKAEQIAARDAELAEVDALIAECAKQGVMTAEEAKIAAEELLQGGLGVIK